MLLRLRQSMASINVPAGLKHLTSGKAKIPGTTIQATTGWYVLIGCVGAIAVSNVPVVGDIAFVLILGANIYQINELLKARQTVSKKG